MKLMIYTCDLPNVELRPHEDESRNFPVWEVMNQPRFYINFTLENEKETLYSGAQIKIPHGFLTDLGSVPKFSLIQPVRFPRPAVLHDFGYRNKTPDSKAYYPQTLFRLFPAMDDYFQQVKDWFDDGENQKKFYDAVLYEQCRRHCKALSRTAPRRIYWAVRLFGGKSFLSEETEETMSKLKQKLSLVGTG